MSIVGILLVLLGVLWTGQGLGYIEGSAMTGSAVWAIIGPIAAAFGGVMVYNARRDL